MYPYDNPERCAACSALLDNESAHRHNGEWLCASCYSPATWPVCSECGGALTEEDREAVTLTQAITEEQAGTLSCTPCATMTSPEFAPSGVEGLYLWRPFPGAPGFFRVVLAADGRLASEPCVNAGHINRLLAKAGWR